MTDEAREAERLRERMQQGELPRKRLTLARFLGHRPSELALGRRDAEAIEAEDSGSLEFFGRRVARWGPQVMLRAALAVAAEVARACEPPAAVVRALEEAFAAVERFLLPPSARPAASEPLAASVERAARTTARVALTLDADTPARRACQATLPLLRATGDLLRRGAPDRRLLDQHYLRVLEQAEASGVDVTRLRGAVRDRLVAWALAE